MDFEKNIDQICYPNYNLGQRTSGLQILFTDESDYIEPYDIDDFKDYARIDFDTDDNLIELFLMSARITVENHLQKSLGVREIKLMALSLPKNFLLPWGPVEGLVDPTDFTLVGDILKEGGTDIEVIYTSNASLVNSNIVNAIYKQALDYYENREKYLKSEGSMEISNLVKLMLATSRNYQFP